MLAVGDRSLAGFGEKCREDALPLKERRRTDVEPVEMEKIEGEVDETVLATVVEVFHQRAKIARAGIVLHDRLAVEDDLVDGESPHRRGNSGKARRPIISVPRE